MFCKESKMSPGTFYVDKKSFDQITANAQHHPTNNVMNLGDGFGKVDPTIKVTNGIFKVNDDDLTDEDFAAGDEEPLESPNMDEIDDSKGIIAAGPDFRPVGQSLMNRHKKEKPLESPVMDFNE